MTIPPTMCSNATKTARRRSTRSMTKPTPTSPNIARKTRKHRFLSLRRHLFSKQPPSTSPEPHAASSGQMTSSTRDATHQLNLFPLHPENLFQDKDDNVPVTCFFDADRCPGADALDGLLWSGASEEEEQEEEEDRCSLYSPSSVTCAGTQDSEGSNGSLERAAFVRSNVREREESEETWVRYEEVIGWSGEQWRESGGGTPGLSLKLDYQEIMNAWMDKGPLYIDGDGPAIVPDLLHDAPHLLNHHHQQEDCSTSTGKVPVMGAADEEAREGSEGWKTGQNREARVLRYKEKRQSRLFAKRIRYEVRKLNAEKRPRLKGRFVKRN